MAPSNNKVADGLLSTAHDSAVHDGLRLAVPQYLQAADALVAEGRTPEALDVLAELIAAKEKKRGFFLMKKVESPLGDTRIDVARRYAKIAMGTPPSEATLDTLNQVALDYPDEHAIRSANADALRQAGYLLDAIDEYKCCKSLMPGDVDADLRLVELYAQLGKPADAATQIRRATADAVSSGKPEAAADLALRMLDFSPPPYEACFEAFSSMNGESLSACRPQFDRAVASFAAADVPDPARRSGIVRMIVACGEKILARDRSDAALLAALDSLEPGTSTRILSALDEASSPKVEPEKPAAEAVSAPKAAPPVDAPPPVEAPPPAAPAHAARPSATAGGLSAFAKRKALELFADSKYDEASQQLERVVRMSPDVESLEMLLECYLALDRHDDAARVGVRLADAELAAGNRPGAIARLTTLSQKIADPTVEQRRVELMKTS